MRREYEYGEVVQVVIGYSERAYFPCLHVQVYGFSGWESHFFRLYALGQLEGLVRGYLEGFTPLGILADRVEEYPEELHCMNPNWHRGIINCMRGSEGAEI